MKIKMLSYCFGSLLFFMLLGACNNNSVSPKAESILADAGDNLVVVVGQRISLDASRSIGQNLNYSWKILSSPAESNAELSQSNSQIAQLTPDIVGNYRIELSITNGTESSQDEITLDARAFEASDELSPQGILRGEGGSLIASPQGASKESLKLRLEPSVMPELPKGISAVGQAHRLSAETLSQAEDHPFIIGLPVPAGAQADRLMMAIMIPGHYALEHGLHSHLSSQQARPKTQWWYLPSSYDKDSQMIFASLHSLVPEELVFTLTTNPFPASKGLRTQATHDFIVFCDPQFLVSDVECTEQDGNDAAQVFEAAYESWTSLGFTQTPALAKVPTCQLNFLESGCSFSAYSAFLRPPDGVAGGWYNSITQTIVITFTDEGFSENTIRHEYFHATQYGHFPHQFTFTDDAWVIEGQARASERSDSVIGGYSARAIEPSLYDSSDSIEYQTGDFWRFLALNVNEGLDYLLPFLEVSGTPESIDAVFANNNLGFDSLNEAYWAWVKNQAFEATVDFASGSFVGLSSCFLNEDVISNKIELDYSPTSGFSGSTAVTLEPLSARLFELSLLLASTEEEHDFYRVLFDLENAHSDLKFKVYQERVGGCAEQADGARSIQRNGFLISITDPKTYLLVANTSLTETRSTEFTASASLHTNLEITQPTYSTVRDGTRVRFEASYEDLQLDDAILQWRINDELVQSDEISGAGTKSMAFYPCPTNATVEASVPTRAITPPPFDSQTITVIPNPLIMEFVAQSWLESIETNGETTNEDVYSLNAVVWQPRCNDPESSFHNLELIVWENSFGILTQGSNYTLSSKDFFDAKGQLSPQSLKISYEGDKGATTSSLLTLYPCLPANVMQIGGTLPPCISAEKSELLEKLFTDFNRFNTKEDALSFSRELLEKELGRAGLSLKDLSLDPSELSARLSKRYSKTFMDHVNNLRAVTASPSLARLKPLYLSYLNNLTQGGLSDEEAKTLLDLSRSVLSLSDAFGKSEEGGKEYWLELLFDTDPNNLADRVNSMQPVSTAFTMHLLLLVSEAKLSPEQLSTITQLSALSQAITQTSNR